MFRHSASSARTSSSSLSSVGSEAGPHAAGNVGDGASGHGPLHLSRLAMALGGSLGLEEVVFDGKEGVLQLQLELEAVRVDIEHSETRRNRRGYTERTGKYTQYTTTPPGEVSGGGGYGRRK